MAGGGAEGLRASGRRKPALHLLASRGPWRVIRCVMLRDSPSPRLSPEAAKRWHRDDPVMTKPFKRRR